MSISSYLQHLTRNQLIKQKIGVLFEHSLFIEWSHLIIVAIEPVSAQRFDIAIVVSGMDADSCVNNHSIELIYVWFLISLLIRLINVVTDKSSEVEPLGVFNKVIDFPALVIEAEVVDDEDTWGLFNSDSLLCIGVA